MKRVLEILGLDPRYFLLVICSTLLTPLLLGAPGAVLALFRGEVILAVVTLFAGLPLLVPGAFLVLPHTLPGVVIVWSLCRAALWWSGLAELRASQIAAGLAGALALPRLLHRVFDIPAGNLLPVYRATGDGSALGTFLGGLWIGFLAAALAGVLAATLVYRTPFSPAWPRGRCG